MLKVTMENVTRLSEEALYTELEKLNEKDGLYTVIEAELDRRIDCHNRLKLKQVEVQLESAKINEAIAEEMRQVFAGVKGKKTLKLVEHLGQEYIEDYIIDESATTVHSKVSHEKFSNPNMWKCSSMDGARRKVANLIYYRIYNKFMREPTEESLELVKAVLAA